MANQTLAYILVTAAKNEEEHIESTILSVVAQSILPKKWIVVSDGSTDRTDEIVSEYVATHQWMELLRMPEHDTRSFASKVLCFNAGHEKIRGIPHDIIGNLDADITFEPDFIEFLLNRFAEDPRLGVAGAPFIEGTEQYDFRYTSIEHVSGACQLFRKQCFLDIGGYAPIKAGGIDWIAVTTARMKGWTTRTFLGKSYFHHRKIGTGDGRSLAAIFKYGRKEYMLGNHPLWQLIRSIFQMRNRPYLLGGFLHVLGYVWGFLTRTERAASPELIAFARREQMKRLQHILLRSIGLAKTQRS